MQLRARDLHTEMAGEDVAGLHRDLERLGFDIPEEERQGRVFGVATGRAVADFQRARGLPASGVVDQSTAAAISRVVAEMRQGTVPMPGGTDTVNLSVGPDVASSGSAVLPAGPQPAKPSPAAPQLEPPSGQPSKPLTLESDPTVVGSLYLDQGSPAAGVTLRVYDRGFGGTATLLGEVTTGPDGRYALDYRVDGAPANLDVRVVRADRTEVRLTDTVSKAADKEVLNLVVPADLVPLASEYARLSGDITAHLNGGSLADARETEEQRDLTLLRTATGWDARLIALAARAEQLTKTTGMEAEALYGMLRAGLPSDPLQLARVTPNGVGLAVRKAVDAGVVALDDKRIATAQAAFEGFARLTRRSLTGPGLLSTYGDMLAASGLTDTEQGRFEEIFAAHTGTVEELWHKLDAAGVPVAPVQITARLGFLTLNNAELIKDLRQHVADPKEIGPFLVGKRFYLTETWMRRLNALASSNGAAVDRLIPPAYAGDTVEERLRAYAADLARKVRLSYPAQVIRDMVVIDQLRLGEWHDVVKNDVATVLDRALTIDGFAIGRVPLGAFLRDHAETLFAGMSAERTTAASEQVKTLFRLYQITPTDEAMKVLLDNGFTSAYDVTALTQAKFMKRYGDKFPSLSQALAVYRKAHQATTVVYSFFGAVEQLAAAPPVHVLSPPAEVADEAKSKLVEQFPTIEGLFGSQDWVACDECQSVLSPAAYLVDILKFLDPDDLVWKGDLAAWAAEHPGEPAPAKPYEVLAARRRDLPVLPLTCQNTHTVMPYIDIVNEILEYYVAHGKLDEAAGHDTGDANTADLLAEPQYVLPEAYQILGDPGNAKYPLTLPFDLWLETVRRFCEHFDTPFWQLLDALRGTDELYLPPTATGYGRSAVFLERLGISPAEYTLLTDPDQATAWYELYGYTDEGSARTELTSAKALARRLDISYRQLVEVLKTGFVNPHLTALAALRKVDIAAEDVLRYFGQPGHAPYTAAERAAFEALLGPDGLAWLQQAWANGDFGKILVLADPNPGGGFEQTTLRYVDGVPVDGMALLAVNYFVRLRRRLGWSIAETDRALQTFLPGTPDPRTPATIGAAMASALLGIAHYDSLSDLLKTGAKTRARLLNLWAPLEEATYVELFLSGSEPHDKAFDDPLGRYLSTPNVPLHKQLSAVQGALQLTADEIGEILTQAQSSLQTATLDMATVSLLYRYRLLARLLKLSVAELITLQRLSGLDPFTPLPPGPVLTSEEDHPYRHTQRFIEVVAAVKESGLTIAELDYLLAHRFDPVGPYRTAVNPPLTLVRTLGAEITRIRAENANPQDALTFTDEMLRQKLALVFPSTVVQTFLGYWAGTAKYDQATVQGFFERYLQKTMIGAKSYGFLDPADLPVVFPPDPAGLEEAAQRQRRARLVEAFLPYLRDRLIRQAIVQYVAGDLACDPALAETLLTDPALLDDPEQADSPLLASYSAIGDLGLSATTDPDSARLDGFIEVPVDGAYRFLVACDIQGSQVELRFDHLADPVLRGTTAADGAELSADIELKANVPYGLTMSATSLAGGGVALLVQGPQLANGPVDRLVCYPRVAVDHLHRTHLLLAKTMRLVSVFELGEREVVHLLTHRSDFDGVDLGELPTQPAADTAAADEKARTLFGWFLRLVEYMRLRKALAAQPGDLVDIFAHARRSYPAGTDPVGTAAEVLADLQGRLAVITRRTPEAVGSAATLLGIRAQPTATGEGVEVVAPDFASERGLGRLWQVLALAGRIGVAPQALGRWATPSPTPQTARDLRDSVKALYDRERWRAVVRPISDALRQHRRDALVAHIMHTGGYDRMEQLFEYFLIDPGTEPVVQASRLGLAMSSVQTFVQRCLLNLEPDVPPFFIDAEQWQWMRRYRVWEANRKIFLWPENWLEPEWRDDKTHLFTALESTLLQSNLSDDDVESALFTYLQGLEEIARLDVRAIYLEEKTKAADNVLHLVARTYGKPHKYFYRMYAYGTWTPWTPVTAKIDGDHLTMVMWRGRLHLFWLTFLDQAKSSASGTNPVTHAGELPVGQLMKLAPRHRYQAQLSWSEYVGGKWTNATSSAFIQLTGQLFMNLFGIESDEWQYWPDGVAPADQFIHATVGDDDSVRIHLTGAGQPGNAFLLVGKNSAPAPAASDPPTAPPYAAVTPTAGGQYGGGQDGLSVTYVEEITTEHGQTTYSCPTTKAILRKGGDYTLVSHGAKLRNLPADIGALVSPFLYQNQRHTFYVEPELSEHRTIETGDDFILATPLVQFELDDPDRWKAISLSPQAPIGPDPVDAISPAAKYGINVPMDWATASTTRIPFNGSSIGVDGDMSILTAQHVQWEG